MLVKKKGKIVDIPIRQGTVVRLREGRNGVLTNRKGIVMKLAKPTAFSRAYGRQAIVCTIRENRSNPAGRYYNIFETGAGDLYPVGKVKKIPKACREELKHSGLSGARRRKKRKR